jgi:hypothetical protein
MQQSKEAEALLKSWTRERRNTVKLFRDLADEIQEQEEKRRAITIAGATTSAVGGYVTIVSSVLAIFTGGATLPITAAAGSTTASIGGLVLLGNELVYKIVEAKATKLLDKAIVKDKKVSGEFWDVLQRIEAKIYGVEGSTVKFVITIGYNSYNLWKKIAESGDQATVANNAFQALDKLGKAKYVASIGLSSISLVLNVKTLAETLVKVYKGKVPKVVSNLREQAQKLEDEIPVYEKKVALLKRRVKIQELFYMAFFVCCIGIIIYFVYNRL